MVATEVLRGVVDEVRRQFAPDLRTAIFEVEVASEQGRTIVRGATSEPAAAEALQRRLNELASASAVFDVVRLPADTDGDAPQHGVVRSATAPLLGGPLSSEAHLSQLVLGDRVLILRRFGNWCQCRVPDGYIGWIHRGYLAHMTEIEARGWELGSYGPLHFSLGATVSGPDGDTLVRLPWGARLACVDSTVILPDGSRGSATGEFVQLERMRILFPKRADAIVESALRWLGAPYIWGGITQNGVDCSGLVQAIYRTHGVEMPRDSDQQEREGTEIEDGSDLTTLLPGDLIFFGEKERRIAHVAISMGGSRIIHSSLNNGGVRINDLLGTAPFEKDLRSLLRSVKRPIEAEA